MKKWRVRIQSVVRISLLAMLAAVLVLWARSLYVGDFIIRTARILDGSESPLDSAKPGYAHDDSSWKLASGQGLISFYGYSWRSAQDLEAAKKEGITGYLRAHDIKWNHNSGDPAVMHPELSGGFLGFRGNYKTETTSFSAGAHRNTHKELLLTIPYWSLALALAIPVAWVWRRHLRFQRPQKVIGLVPN